MTNNFFFSLCVHDHFTIFICRLARMISSSCKSLMKFSFPLVYLCRFAYLTVSFVFFRVSSQSVKLTRIRSKIIKTMVIAFCSPHGMRELIAPASFSALKMKHFYRLDFRKWDTLSCLMLSSQNSLFSIEIGKKIHVSRLCHVVMSCNLMM